AKIVCSNAFIASRDPAEVLSDDVQAPGHPLLEYVSVTRREDHVTARLFGFIAGQTALSRPGLGCTVVAHDDIEGARKVSLAEVPDTDHSDLEWPLGDQVSRAQSVEVDAVIGDETLAGPGMRAIVVVKDGRVIAERYGDGFDADT